MITIIRRQIPAKLRDSRTREQGSISLFIVVVFLALIATAGLIIDGGVKLRAAREASAVSEEAARTGAGVVDRDRAYAHKGRFLVDKVTAAAAARAYLNGNGNNGSVTIISDQSIRVTVTIYKPATLLPIVGIDRISATKTATADLLQGVGGEGR